MALAGLHRALQHRKVFADEAISDTARVLDANAIDVAAVVDGRAILALFSCERIPRLRTLVQADAQAVQTARLL